MVTIERDQEIRFTTLHSFKILLHDDGLRYNS